MKLAYLLVLLHGARGRPAARAVRLVHAPAAAGLARRRGQAKRFEEGAREFLKTARAKQLQDKVGEVTGIADSEPRSRRVERRAQARGGRGPPRGVGAGVMRRGLRAGGQKAKPVGEVLRGLGRGARPMQGLDGGDRDERLATIDDIREQVNLKDSAVETPELSDKAAYRVLDSICSAALRGSFRLYKLYARATASPRSPRTSCAGARPAAV